MKEHRFQKEHEALGDEYLRRMDELGLIPPPVCWVTGDHPVAPTFAVILWDDEVQEVSGYPRAMLVEAVVTIVATRCRELLRYGRN